VAVRSGEPVVRGGGELVGDEAGGEGNPFWHLEKENTHHWRLPVAAGLTGARPEERRVAPVVGMKSIGASWWSSWMRRRHRTGT
jgi:hypothetical protein